MIDSTPKQKAEELIEKYNDRLQRDMTCIVYLETTKQCTLICVAEIINMLQGMKESQFWEQVEQELRNL